MCAIAHATDGAGSIRYPAAYCGLFGLKPQRNRVSLSPDREHWYGLSVSGCVSRTVMDTALYLDVMSGPERGDFDSPPPFERPLVEAAGRPRASCGSPARPRRSSPSGRRPRCSRPMRRPCALLRSLGHEVTEASPSYGRMYTDFYPLYFRGIRDEAADACRIRSGSPTRRRGSSGSGACSATGGWRRSATAWPRGRPGSQLFRGLRPLVTPGHGAAPGRDRALARQGRAADDQRDGERLSLRGDLELHGPAGGDHPGRASARVACRAR